MSVPVHSLPTDNAMLRTLVDMQERYIFEGLTRAWWDYALDRVITLTGCEFGFIGRIAEQDGHRVLISLGITNIAWNDWSHEVYDTYAAEGLTFDNPRSLFGITVADGTTVISNDPGHDPRSGGLPEGHPPLLAYVGVPLTDRSGMVGMLGLANRPGGFDHTFVEGLRPITGFIGEIVGREVLALEHAEKTAALEQTQHVQRALYEARDLIVFTVDEDGVIALANEATVAAVGPSVTHDASVYDLLVDGDDRVWVTDALHAAGGRRDLAVRRDIGDPLRVRFTVSPIGGDRMLFIGIDLSDRRALDESRVEQARLSARVEQLEEEGRELRTVTEAVDAALMSTELGGVRTILKRVLAHAHPTAAIGIYRVEDDGRLVLDTAASDARCAPTVGADDCWALRVSRMHLTSPAEVTPECTHVTPNSIAVCVPIDAAGDRYGLVAIEFPVGDPGPSEIVQARIATVVQRFAVVMAAVSLRDTLRSQALTDDLTGLMNRAAIVHEVSRLMARGERTGQPAALMLIDLDHFKEVNDDQGHQAGDLMLRRVADVLRAEVRAGDYCARFGGDEFAVLLPDTDMDIAMITAERLRTRIREIVVHGQGVTASVGLVGCCDGGHAWESWDEVYRAVDDALYAAKADGRDGIRVVS